MAIENDIGQLDMIQNHVIEFRVMLNNLGRFGTTQNEFKQLEMIWGN